MCGGFLLRATPPFCGKVGKREIRKDIALSGQDRHGPRGASPGRARRAHLPDAPGEDYLPERDSGKQKYIPS